MKLWITVVLLALFLVANQPSNLVNLMHNKCTKIQGVTGLMQLALSSLLLHNVSSLASTIAALFLNAVLLISRMTIPTLCYTSSELLRLIIPLNLGSFTWPLTHICNCTETCTRDRLDTHDYTNWEINPRQMILSLSCACFCF